MTLTISANETKFNDNFQKLSINPSNMARAYILPCILCYTLSNATYILHTIEYSSELSITEYICVMAVTLTVTILSFNEKKGGEKVGEEVMEKKSKRVVSHNRETS